MRKKKLAKKRLALDKETIRLLAETRIVEVYGGFWTCGCTGGCPPYTGNTCSCLC